jgi:hypothetical protein
MLTVAGLKWEYVIKLIKLIKTGTDKIPLFTGTQHAYDCALKNGYVENSHYSYLTHYWYAANYYF